MIRTRLRFTALLTCVAVVCAPVLAYSAPKPPTRTDEAKRIATLLSKRDYAGVATTFDDTMKKALPADRLKQVWQSLINQVGEFKKQTGTRTEKAQVKGVQYDVVLVTCEFQRATLDLKVVFGPPGKVSGLFIVPTRPPSR